MCLESVHRQKAGQGVQGMPVKGTMAGKVVAHGVVGKKEAVAEPQGIQNPEVLGRQAYSIQSHILQRTRAERKATVCKVYRRFSVGI